MPLLGVAEAILPWGDAAHRGALLSALLASTAVVLVHRTGLLLVPPGRAGGASAALGAALTALAPGLWSQATIVEVYAGSALLVAVALWLGVRYAARPRPVLFVQLGILVGIALAHHPTLLLGAPGFLPLLVRRPRPTRRAWLAAGAAALCIPALAYGTILARASADPPLNWGDPSNLAALWAHVSAAAYRPYFLSGSLEEYVGRLAPAARFLAWQYTPLGLLVAALGWAVMAGRDRRLAAGLAWWVVAALVFTLAYFAADPENYLLPAVLTFGLLVAPGAHAVGQWGGGRPRVAAGAIFVALVPFQLLFNAAQMDLSHDGEARAWGEGVLYAAAPNGEIVTDQDRQTFALWYLQYVAGLRPDVIVVDRHLLAQPWYRERVERRWPGTVARLGAAPLSIPHAPEAGR